MTPVQPTFELVLTGGPAAHQFTAGVPDGSGGRAAEHTFEWRTDSTALAMDLGALAHAAVSGRPPANDLHRTFGQRLFTTVFAGAVDDLWRARLAELRPRRQPLRLIIRPDPASARPLLNLPWEYLHDGHDFLALNWRTPLSRLPWDLPAEPLPLLTEPLRVLVLIAAPLGLSQDQVLNTAHEEDLILGALAAARRAGRIEIEFTPNGTPQALEAALREFDPHVLHFVGHGVFVSALDSGLLLMERPDGHQCQVPNAGFAELIERQAKSLRLVFLSACQSAVAPRNEGYADLAPRLLAADVPAVVAMQYSVLNRSAMAFGSAFYKGLADGDPIDGALTEARNRLARESPNTVDFATPVLFLADPGCLQVDQAALRPARPPTPLDLTGVIAAQNFVGRSAELRTLQTGLDPERGPWRAAVIHGLGGMGKTVLAARLAGRMAARFDGVKAIRMTPTLTAQSVLDLVGAFLLVNNARLNSPLIPAFVRLKDEPLPLESKAAALIEILRSLRLLLIFDNYEDVLPNGQVVSRAAGGGVNPDREVTTKTPGHEAPPSQPLQSLVSSSPGGYSDRSIDPDLPKLIALLVEGVPGPSRCLFTSRVDFSPVEAGRLAGAIGHLDLGEMQFRDAVYLMETLPPLDRLPVAVLPETRPDVPPLTPTPALPRQQGRETGEGPGVSAPALSRRDLYARLGGHPYTLTLFAEHARRSSPEAVLADLAGVRKELLDFTLLDRAAARLPERARRLVHRAAIYDEPVPLEGLAFMLGDGQDVMPPVEDEVQALLGWGVLARPPGSAEYAVHTPVRDWARAAMTADERLALWRRAAQFWLGVGRDSHDLGDFLRARHYLFQAGDYEQADDVVQFALPYLHRWGQIELVLRLLTESVRTLSGNRRAVALSNLARVYGDLGEYAAARKIYKQVLTEFQAIGDRRNVAVALHQLGMLHQAQGEYGPARERYAQSLAIAEELGDRAGVAISLHQLGMLHQAQGEYGPARARYEQSLAIKQELGDRAGVASSLHNLGALHQAQGEYGPARARYEQSLAILQELGDRAGVARSLHQLGNLHYLQGEYGRARARYEQSLAIEQELGDRAGVARSLHALGMLHQAQGEYGPARERYEQSLAIFQELGDRAGVAGSLHNLATLFEEEGAYMQAVQFAAQAFVILDQLGSPDRDIAGRTLARLQEKMGTEAFEAALQAALTPSTSPSLHSGLRLLRAGPGPSPESREGGDEPESGDDAAEQGMTIEQALPLVVNNTVAVLTRVPEKKAEWWGMLGQLQGQVKAQGLDEFAAFLGVLRQLVEGAKPESLASEIPAAFRQAWQAVVRGLAGK
jgi:tetratricopeptide (TPR) repeat protein